MSDFVSQPNLPSLAMLLVLQQASVVWLGGLGFGTASGAATGYLTSKFPTINVK